MLKKPKKPKKKKNEPIASNTVSQVFSKVDEEVEPEPASLYDDEYAEYKAEDDENDTDTESIVSIESGVSVASVNETIIEDEEFNKNYSFIAKVTPTVKKLN